MRDQTDTRERIEADAWEAARLDMSRTWEERRDAIVALLDRQAALTEREVEHDLMKAGRMAVEVERERIAELQAKLDQCMESYADARDSRDALQAELDERDQTHVPLPVDADGVPIRVGDLIKLKEDPDREASTDFYITIGKAGVRLNGDGWEIEPSRFVHVEPRTVEDVLFSFWHEFGRESEWKELEGRISEYAAEIRELLANDGLAPESGVSGHGWRSNDGEVDV